MVVRGLVPAPTPPPKLPGKGPMLTSQVVWLIGLVFVLGAVMTLVGHMNVFLAFGLPVAVVIAILGAIGIGRVTNTVYRDVLTFFQQSGNDGRGTP